jgi:sugar transferase (PEP-CTERM/EpsH1 system associated)
MAQYLPKPARFPVVVDFVDVDSDKWRMFSESTRAPAAWIYALEARRLAWYESKVAAEAALSIFVSDAEAALFRRRGIPGDVEVIESPMDVDSLRPAEGGSADEGRSLVFVGVMDYLPNVDAVCWFADEVLPQVRRLLPEARFTIVGRRPARRVRLLARREHVHVTGAVDDVRPFLRGAALAVAPFRVARGVQSKILEAMAMGLPVVGTSLAFQGIRAGSNDGVRIANDPEGQARAIVDLLRAPEERRLASLQARAFVERNHRWESLGRELEARLESVIAGWRGSRPASTGS